MVDMVVSGGVTAIVDERRNLETMMQIETIHSIVADSTIILIKVSYSLFFFLFFLKNCVATFLITLIYPSWKCHVFFCLHLSFNCSKFSSIVSIFLTLCVFKTYDV